MFLPNAIIIRSKTKQRMIAYENGKRKRMGKPLALSKPFYAISSLVGWLVHPCITRSFLERDSQLRSLILSNKIMYLQYGCDSDMEMSNLLLRHPLSYISTITYKA